MEAETTYKASVCEANERHGQLLRVKSQVLQQVRELMLQCDQTMKAVTVSYFQLQHTVSAPAPVQVFIPLIIIVFSTLTHCGVSTVSDFVRKQQIVRARLAVHGIHQENALTQQAQQRQHPDSHYRKPEWHIPRPIHL